MKIAIQGIKGAFHEEAAILLFDSGNLEVLPCLTFEGLAEEVSSNRVDYGMMAIENTIAGTILSNLELIRQHKLWINTEVYLRIRQNLGGIPGATLEKIREVHSHYMALNQCREYFADHPHIQLIQSEDTALSIQEVALKGTVEMAAIGSALAMKYYGLEILAEEIETDKQNYTRFLLLSSFPKHKVDDFNKVTISLVPCEISGAFFQIMEVMNQYDLELTKIESGAILGEPWHYRFYIDLYFNRKGQFENMVKALQPLVKEFIIMGQYIAANNLPE